MRDPFGRRKGRALTRSRGEWKVSRGNAVARSRCRRNIKISSDGGSDRFGSDPTDLVRLLLGEVGDTQS